jgi:hypothetical protein
MEVRRKSQGRRCVGRSVATSALDNLDLLMEVVERARPIHEWQ